MRTLGMRHLALNVKNVEAAKKFYTDFFGMELQWQPDPHNVYLTSAGADNLALHEKKEIHIDIKNQALDHLGFVMPSKEAVNEMYQNALRKNISIVKEPKQHRDGAFSFYVRDPDGYVVQVIYYPAIVTHSSSPSLSKPDKL